jgi:glycosyltransferase involved in cell wall biosynthesis
MRTLIDGHDALRMVHVPVNKGYGFGILSGLEVATGDVMGWCHADLQTDPSDVKPAMAIFENAPNPERLFVKGLRKRRALSDTAFTIGMSFFETVLFRRKLWDINAQPTLFHRSFYETLSDAPHDFSLDLYVYATARKRGIEVKRVPVFFPERQHGESSWNTNAAAKVKFIKRTISYSFALKSHFNGRA